MASAADSRHNILRNEGLTRCSLPPKTVAAPAAEPPWGRWILAPSKDAAARHVRPQVASVVWRQVVLFEAQEQGRRARDARPAIKPQRRLLAPSVPLFRELAERLAEQPAYLLPARASADCRRVDQHTIRQRPSRWPFSYLCRFPAQQPSCCPSRRPPRAATTSSKQGRRRFSPVPHL